jgi:hypothetical protein
MRVAYPTIHLQEQALVDIENQCLWVAKGA